MPYREKTIEEHKKYWTIAEVAKELNVTTSHIRYYENYFNLRIKRKKNIQKSRVYTKTTRSYIDTLVKAASILNLIIIRDYELWKHPEKVSSIYNLLKSVENEN